MDDLRRRWPTLLASHPALRDRLLADYASPRRHYHDTRHLAEVLTRLDALLAQPGTAVVDRDAVVLAAWFHDAVYDGLPDDVERSAGLAASTLAETGLPDDLVAEVARLVRVTLEHRPTEGDLAGQVLSDADLAILAADPARYAEYVAGVREEYHHLDDDTFRHGRAEVLRALLDRPRLFHTPLAVRSWEAAARVNVERELAALSATGGSLGDSSTS